MQTPTPTRSSSVHDLGWFARAQRRLGELARHRGVEIPIEQLMLGGQNGIPAVQYASMTGDLAWRSTRLIDGPHVDLFQRFAAGEAIPRDGEQFTDVPYVRLARACILHTGFYFQYSDVTQLSAIIDRTRQRWSAESAARLTQGPSRPLVRPIRHSRHFEIVNGHHRLAHGWVEGWTTAVVDVTWSTAPPW